MKLKILIAPALVVAVTVIAIWVVAPQFFNMRGSIKQLEESVKKLADIREKNAQAEKLIGELEGSSEKKDVVMKFIPTEQKEEEIIDNLNYYASFTGLAIYNLDISRPKQTAENDATIRSLLASGTDESGNISEGKKESLKDFSAPQNLEVNLGVAGTYERLKDFFGKISQLSRYNSISSLEISVAPESGEAAGGGANLQADAVLVFNYLEKSDKAVISLDNSIFSKENFDMSVIDEIQKKMATSVFKLELEKTGRDNPFLIAR